MRTPTVIGEHPLIEEARAGRRKAVWPRVNTPTSRFWHLEYTRRYTKLADALKRAGLYGADFDKQREFLRSFKLRVRVPAPVRVTA
jgi:hypothetical protein